MGVRGRVDRRGMQQGARGAHKRACVGRTGRHSAGRVAGGAGAQHKRSAGSGVRGAARRGGAGARDLAHRHSGHGRLGGTGRAASAHRVGQLGANAPGLVFNLVFRLGIFPESLNEHCSL